MIEFVKVFTWLLVECIYMKEQVLFFVCIVEVDREKGFHLDLEDYLAGILIMASELVRH